MAYTSHELFHFVGSSLSNDLERWKLLIAIIRSGRLLANKKEPGNRPVISSDANFTPSDYLGEIFRRTDCVCFADIPREELKIHTEKFSKYGLSFSKKFLLSFGARPVIYVPCTADVYKAAGADILTNNPNEYFTEIQRLCSFYLPYFDVALSANPNWKQPYETLINTGVIPKSHDDLYKSIIPEIDTQTPHALLYTLENFICTTNAYVKLFDPCLADNDPENYYMEREWRCLQDVTFTTGDIEHVFLPETEYTAEIFINIFPELKDKIIPLSFKE